MFETDKHLKTPEIKKREKESLVVYKKGQKKVPLSP